MNSRAARIVAMALKLSDRDEAESKGKQNKGNFGQRVEMKFKTERDTSREEVGTKEHKTEDAFVEEVQTTENKAAKEEKSDKTAEAIAEEMQTRDDKTAEEVDAGEAKAAEAIAEEMQTGDVEAGEAMTAEEDKTAKVIAEEIQSGEDKTAEEAEAGEAVEETDENSLNEEDNQYMDEVQRGEFPDYSSDDNAADPTYVLPTKKAKIRPLQTTHPHFCKNKKRKLGDDENYPELDGNSSDSTEKITIKKPLERRKIRGVNKKIKLQQQKNQGQAYKNKPARSMKPACTCKLKCYLKVPESARQSIFEKYWATGQLVDLCSKGLIPESYHTYYYEL